MTDKELLNEAEKASLKSYSPYSRFRVGAALLTKSGKLYLGCNIENASFGAAVCAERTAVFKAVSDGETEFQSIAVFSPDGKSCTPCGICRQVLAEFSPDISIVYRQNGVICSSPLKELLPLSFDLDNV